MKLLILFGRLSPFIMAFTIPVFIVLVWFNLVFLKPYDSSSQEVQSVVIPSNANIEQIANILADNSLVRSEFATRLLLQRLEKKQEDPLIFIEGEYEISPSYTPSKILDHLLTGKKITRNIEVVAGERYYDIAQKISDSRLFPKETILSAMTKRELLIKLRVDAGIPEGYFLPGKFTFSKPIEPEQVVETLITESKNKLIEELPNYEKRISDLKLSNKHELLTLASMLEKEADTYIDRKKLAGLYHNRIMLKIPLESMKALAYSQKGETKNVTMKDTETPGPYNTFLLFSYPKTPICSPSIDSLRAALYPEISEYLYFFRNENGELVFSETIEEHEKKKNS